MEGTIGEIRMFAGNFAPSSWALCQGQLVLIRTNAALFSLIGVYFGGNGTTNFALPDYRGRMPLGVGQGVSLSAYNLGNVSGVESFTVAVSNMPSHTHTMTSSVTISGTLTDGNSDKPIGNYPAVLTGTNMYATASDGSFMSNMQHNLGTSLVGSSVPVNNIQPALALNFVICIQGTYPFGP